MKYTDPSGELPVFIPIFLGAIINTSIQIASGNVHNGAQFFASLAIGAVSGAVGVGVGQGVASTLMNGGFLAGALGKSTIDATFGFWQGALIGGAGTGAAGLISGTFNAWNSSKGFSQSLGQGATAAAWGVASGMAIGGLTTGISTAINGKNFWNGSEKAQIYRSPVSDNIGLQDGGCSLLCFEEFSQTYGMEQYNYNYWLDWNCGKLGVKANDVEWLVNSTGVFSSESVLSAPSSIIDAFSNDKRVMAGFITDKGGEHAVMINKLKIWPDGRYRIWFSETSQVRFVPYSTTNIYSIEGMRFFTFFPR